jgi:glucan phosphoethanolaminetransferase (alkaline phosphatase superfamily)
MANPNILFSHSTMRRYFLLLSGIVLTACLLLHFYFHYNIIIAGYHLLVMAITQAIGYIGIQLCFLVIRRHRPFAFVLHTLLLTNLLAILLIYLLILGSNLFWKKTITIPLIRDYLWKTASFVSSLPIDSGLFYSAITLMLLSGALAYFFVRPNPRKLAESWSGRRSSRFISIFTGGIGMLIVLLVVFRQPLVRMKRYMQFAEEPLLQLTGGNLWGTGNEFAFDKARYELGQKDALCFDTLKMPAKFPARPVIVILLDAMRSDHMSAYGYTRNTTPFLDSMIRTRRLLQVRHAFSVTTNTIGGVGSLFFSRDWDRFGFTGLNLMKYLKGAGYTTYSFLTGYHRDWYGLSALYRGSSDYYYESPSDPQQPPDDDFVTMEQFQNATLAPRCFVYIHLMSTHTIGRKHDAFKKFMPDKISLNTDQRASLINNYDNGVLQADFMVRSIFAKLQRDGLFAQSTIYILSDHGELFGEGGNWSHGGSIHPGLLNIPMLISDPDTSWYRNQEMTTLLDVAPSIVERLGLPVPACWEGRSLHYPTGDFRIEVKSPDRCPIPRGVLKKEGAAYRLETFNDKGRLHSVFRLSGLNWLETEQKQD